MRGKILQGAHFLIGFLEPRAELGKIGDGETGLLAVEEDVVGAGGDSQLNSRHGLASEKGELLASRARGNGQDVDVA